MACDLTLVLARSFKEVTFRAQSQQQPNEKDVSAAARNYAVRGYSQHVHQGIKKLIPRKSLAASYKVENVRQGVEDVLVEYKDKLMEDVDLPLNVQVVKLDTKAGDDTSTEADSMLSADFQDARVTLTKLDANGSNTIAELDVTKPVVELPAELDGATPMAELPAENATQKLESISTTGPAELEGSTVFLR